MKLDNPPRAIPFERGRKILITHNEFEDHHEAVIQYLEKHPEDDGELWVGIGITLEIACIDAVLKMFKGRNNE